MGEFRMPSLGADMEYGTVVEWRVSPGDTVKKGDIVAVVDTDKATIEVEVFEDGEVAELLIPTGREVAVGTALARIVTAGPVPAVPAPAEPVSAVPVSAEPVPPAAAPKRERPKKRATSATVPPMPSRPPMVPDVGRRIPASPLARRLASERGNDLARVTGTGPGGAVVARDLDQTLPPTTPIPPTPARASTPATKHEAMRSAIAGLMSRSKREIPHYYLATTIDFSAASTWLADRNASRPVSDRVLPAALLLRATALAARRVPCVNGFWDNGFQPASGVHLAVAISLRGGGLVAPAIHDADMMTLDALMAALSDLVQRARAGSLRASEMSDPTITVTNLGDQGVEEVFGVIYPPQVAIVGFGRIVERPCAVNGLLGVRPTVRATLAGDHRASDGHDGGRFLALVDELLQNPEAL